MGEFFNFFNRFDSGWKRLGLRMLLLAAVFVVGWIRSLSVCDEVWFHTASDSTHLFVSTDSSMIWERRHGVNLRQAPSSSVMELFGGMKFVDVSPSDPRHSRWDWKWRRCGFGGGEYLAGYGSDEKNMIRHTYWCVPYWSIVIPLTLISAWFLLSKPRQSKSKMPVQPVPETAA